MNASPNSVAAAAVAAAVTITIAATAAALSHPLPQQRILASGGGGGGGGGGSRSRSWRRRETAARCGTEGSVRARGGVHTRSDVCGVDDARDWGACTNGSPPFRAAAAPSRHTHLYQYW